MFKLFYVLVLGVCVQHVSGDGGVTLDDSAEVEDTRIIESKLSLARPAARDLKHHSHFSNLPCNVKAQKVADGLIQLTTGNKVNQLYDLAGMSILFLHSKEYIIDYKEFIGTKFPKEFERFSRDKILGVAVAEMPPNDRQLDKTDGCYAVIVIMRRSAFLDKLGSPIISVSAIIKGIGILEYQRKAIEDKQDDSNRIEVAECDTNMISAKDKFSAEFPTGYTAEDMSGESLDNIATEWVTANGNVNLVLNTQNTYDPAGPVERNRSPSYAFFYLNRDNKLTIAAMRFEASNADDEVNSPAAIDAGENDKKNSENGNNSAASIVQTPDVETSGMTDKPNANKYNTAFVSDQDAKLEKQAMARLQGLRYRELTRICKAKYRVLVYQPLVEDTGHALTLLDSLVESRKKSTNKSTTAFEVYDVKEYVQNVRKRTYQCIVMTAASVNVSVGKGENFGDVFCAMLEKINPGGNSGERNTDDFNITEEGLIAFALRVLTYSGLNDAQADYVVEIVLLKDGKWNEKTNPPNSIQESSTLNDKAGNGKKQLAENGNDLATIRTVSPQETHQTDQVAEAGNRTVAANGDGTSGQPIVENGRMEDKNNLNKISLPSNSGDPANTLKFSQSRLKPTGEAYHKLTWHSWKVAENPYRDDRLPTLKELASLKPRINF